MDLGREADNCHSLARLKRIERVGGLDAIFGGQSTDTASYCITPLITCNLVKFGLKIDSVIENYLYFCKLNRIIESC